MKNTNSNSPKAPTTKNSYTTSPLGYLYSLALTDLTSTNLKSGLQRIAKRTVSYFDADRTCIMLKDKTTGQLTTIAKANRRNTKDLPMTVSDAVVQGSMETGQAILVQNLIDSREFAAQPGAPAAEIKSIICAPLKTCREVFGVIYLDTVRNNRNWDRQHSDLLNFAARYLGAAIVATSFQQEKQRNERLITAGQVTVNISHSVKNILQLISGATEMLDFGLRTNQIHRVKRSWKILKPNMERVKKFTLDMLDFTGQKDLQLEPCQFNTIIQAAVESIQTQLKERKIKLHLRIDRRIPETKLDYDKIHQMAVNIILNAIDIVDPDTGIVAVNTKYLASKGRIELIVTDNGPALTDDQKEEIFVPFQSVRNNTGSGLGLAIAKRIIQQHNGRIEVQSEREKGTTIKVILPDK